MTSTLNPVCPLCGLRFAARPLLELHIREDHPRRNRRDPGGTPTVPPRADSPPYRHDLTSRPPRTEREVTAMTATHRPGSGRKMTGPRRVMHALRYVNDELTRAGEAIIRSARAPQSRPQAPATTAQNRDTTPGPADRAA